MFGNTWMGEGRGYVLDASMADASAEKNCEKPV